MPPYQPPVGVEAECEPGSHGRVLRNKLGLKREIDCLLAKHYGFTDEELDFIINYDIKYRMGREGGNEVD